MKIDAAISTGVNGVGTEKSQKEYWQGGIAASLRSSQ